MRKVSSALLISLDGVTQSPEKWQFDHFDAEMMASLGAHLEDEDTVLLGRVTYQEWAAYWPTSTDEPFASYINNVPKVVVSTTLARTDWRNSTLLQGSLTEEIVKLKQQSGKNIGVAGSPTLVRSLLLSDLLDELTLMIHPVVVGSGRRFFDGVTDLKRLELISSKITPAGVAILTYRSRVDHNGVRSAASKMNPAAA